MLALCFTEQGSSASQMMAAGVLDVMARPPGCEGQAFKNLWFRLKGMRTPLLECYERDSSRRSCSRVGARERLPESAWLRTSKWAYFYSSAWMTTRWQRKSAIWNHVEKIDETR